MKTNASFLPLFGVGLLTFASPLLAGLLQTPEPSSMLLIGGGLGVLFLLHRSRRAKK